MSIAASGLPAQPNIAEHVAASRARQGLPAHVTDPEAVARVVALVRVVRPRKPSRTRQRSAAA